jgi:hypothetical protein
VRGEGRHSDSALVVVPGLLPLRPTHRFQVNAKRVGDRPESVLRQVVIQHPAHLVEVAVVADFVDPVDGGDSWLFGVEFPRVKVHHEGVFVIAVPGVDGAAEHGVRDLAEPVATGDRDAEPKQLPGGRRDFPDRSGKGVVLMDEAAMRLTGERAEHRQHAGVVRVTIFCKHVERPEIVLTKPPIGDPVTDDAMPGGGFEDFPRAGEVVAKILARQIADVSMVEAAAGDLVPAVSDFGNQLGHPLGHPAEDEERRFCVVPIEQLENGLS